MDRVSDLLQVARDAGLAVEAVGDKLRVTGPRQAEPLALQILDLKPAVMAVLARNTRARSYKLGRPPGDTRYIVRAIDPDRPASISRCAVVAPGGDPPPGAWAWREWDGETWFRFARQDLRGADA